MKDQAQVVVRPSLYVTARFACGHDDAVRRDLSQYRVRGLCTDCEARRTTGNAGSPGYAEACGQRD